jgi:branched-chain amino acid transport system substrate-binding protein
MKTYFRPFFFFLILSIVCLGLIGCTDNKTDQKEPETVFESTEGLTPESMTTPAPVDDTPAEPAVDVPAAPDALPEAPTEAPAAKTPAGEPIRIGVAGAHSGELASYGLPTVNAVILVTDAINARGGLLGRPIERVVEDDVCKPEIATNSATKLVTSHVAAVIGHICSGPTKAALNIYRDADLVCVSPSATNTDLTLSSEYPNFFRTISHDAAQAKLQVDFALTTLKVKKVAILHDKGDYGKGSATLAKQFFEESGLVDIVLFEGVTPGAVDYSAIVQKVKYAGAQLVVWGGYYPEASRIVKQMRVKKMDALLMGSDGLKDENFITTAGEYAEGVYVSGPLDTSRNPLYIQATEEHKARFGEEPGAFYFNAYAAILALTNAIEKAGSTDYAAVTKALTTEFVDTPIGRISFDQYGDAIGAGFTMYQVQNGVFTQLR